jgi:transcriptional regulator with GAF, ATPase, and Fis domain
VPSCPSSDPPQERPRNKSINFLAEEELKLYDRQNILNALNQCGWGITDSNRSSKILDMRPTTLHSKTKKMGIKRLG